MLPKIIDASIVTAFNKECIGTKVDRIYTFRAFLAEAVAKFDFASQRIPGQGKVELPEEAIACVIAGEGRHTGNPDHYCIRKHWSGAVRLYLKRDLAAYCTGVAAIVNTRDAYLADPDVVGTDEAKRIMESDATHVLVAVLAYAGPDARMPPSTFVRNLAGANNEALAWTADEIRAKAREIQDYDTGWCAVAD